MSDKLAKKYELAYKKLYAELPQWKRELVDDKHSSYNFDAKKADNDLKACPECKMVWQIREFNDTVEFKYYDSVPSYGKVKKVCPRCKIRMKNKYYTNSEVC